MATTSIEGKLLNLQATKKKLQADSLGVVTEQMVEDVKQTTAQCTIKFVVIQVELGGLCAKISTSTE